jgi:hypothetical protein
LRTALLYTPLNLKVKRSGSYFPKRSKHQCVGSHASNSPAPGTAPRGTGGDETSSRAKTANKREGTDIHVNFSAELTTKGLPGVIIADGQS